MKLAVKKKSRSIFGRKKCETFEVDDKHKVIPRTDRDMLSVKKQEEAIFSFQLDSFLSACNSCAIISKYWRLYIADERLSRFFSFHSALRGF